jgi:hypothetical protein
MKIRQNFISIFLCLAVLCSGNSAQKVANNDANTVAAETFVISPLYPDTVYFSVESFRRNETKVTGSIEGFHDKSTETHELYFQRFVDKQGRFRVIHCVGSGIETTSEFGKETSAINNFNDTIKFDEMGIFGGDASDPVDLIPLYPGHPVKQGEYWKPEAKIKILFGTGIAKYSFVIDSVYRDEKGSILARVNVEFSADLLPAKGFEGGTVTAAGSGWLIWDCTINQRRETHVSATYIGTKGRKEVKQTVNLEDKLKSYQGKKQF